MAQCEATAKSTGERCKKDAIPGTNVCHVHGGNAPQVRKKAQERLNEMADQTTAAIQSDIEDLQAEYENADDPETKLAILKELRQNWKIILDRTGHGPTETRELTGEDGDPLDVNATVTAEFVTYGNDTD